MLGSVVGVRSVDILAQICKMSGKGQKRHAPFFDIPI